MSPITTVERTLELRIHERETATPGDGTVDFTLAHSRFQEVPSFGGQVVRYTEGRTESEPYWLSFLDLNGEFTAFMAASGRMAVLGRLAELRIATDGGAFTRVDLRRLSNLRGGSEGAFDVELSDERWIERRTLLFEKTTSWQLDPFGQSVAWMGRAAKGTRSYGVDVVGTDYVALFPLAGVQHVTPLVVTVLRGDLLEDPTITAGAFDALRFADPAATDRTVLRFDPDLDAVAAGGVVTQLTDPLGPFLRLGEDPFWNAVLVHWPSHGLTQGATVTGRLHWPAGIPTTKDTPYLLGGTNGIRAPDLYQEIAAGDHGGPVQQVAAGAFSALSGDIYPPGWYRIEEPKPRDRWTEDNCCRPYGVLPFTDDGALAPRSMRPPQDVDPDTLYEFNLSNVREGLVWEHPGREAITAVTLRAQARLPVFNLVFPVRRRRVHDTVTLLGLKEQDLQVDTIFRWQDLAGVFAGLTTDLFERFGDAPQRWDGTALIEDASPVPGDLVVLDLDELRCPNAATGARTGKRVVHVLERRRVYEAEQGFYQYRWLDAGPNSQPLASPTVVISQTTGDTKHGVDVAVSSVPAGATAIVQLAHGASPAAADWFTVRTGVGNETITIGNRPSNTLISARAIATAPNRIRSGFSTVDDVTTASLTAPSAVTATAAGRSVKVEATLGETTYAVEYLIDDVSQIILPAGSSQHTLHGLDAGTFDFGVRHRDAFGGVSATTEDTETTGTPLPSPDLAAFSAEAGVLDDPSDQPIVPLEDPEILPVVALLRFLAGDPAWEIVLERAPDDSGSPDEGDIQIVARVPGSTRSHEDHRPQDGATWWYRGFHARQGWDDGDPSAWHPVTFADLDTKRRLVPAIGDDDVMRLKRDTVYDDGHYAPMGAEDGHLADGISKYDGPTLHALARHVEEPAFGRDGDSKTFAAAYEHAPTLVLAALKLRPVDGARDTLRVFAQNVSASGYDIVAKNVDAGATTAREDDFPAGNLLDALGETTELTFGNAPANDDAYVIHYSVELSAHAEENGPKLTLTIVVAIDTDTPGDGSWVERKTKQYSVSQDGWSGLDPDAEILTRTHEQQTVNVSGLDTSSKVRVRIKSVTITGTGTTTIDVHGFNKATDADPAAGATYTTATDDAVSATPNAEDGVQFVPVETS